MIEPGADDSARDLALLRLTSRRQTSQRVFKIYNSGSSVDTDKSELGSGQTMPTICIIHRKNKSYNTDNTDKENATRFRLASYRFYFLSVPGSSARFSYKKLLIYVRTMY